MLGRLAGDVDTQVSGKIRQLLCHLKSDIMASCRMIGRQRLDLSIDLRFEFPQLSNGVGVRITMVSVRKICRIPVLLDE